MQPHRAYLGMGSNLGDRLRNLAEALEELRAWGGLERVSGCYETAPVGYLEQPDFLNLACLLVTELSPGELLGKLKDLERRMGRQAAFRNAPRPMDVDILLYDDLVLDSPELALPHPRMSERAFVLAPLADIAPDAVHPLSGKTVGQLLAATGTQGVRPLRPARDLQPAEPRIYAGLGRAGSTNLERIIQVTRSGRAHFFCARLDLFVDPDPGQTGVPMSRFGDLLEEIAGEVAREQTPAVEALAERIASRIAERHRARRSEVRIRAVCPADWTTPATGKTMQELCAILGMAVSRGKSSRKIVGVEVERTFRSVPIASCNQRGVGTLLVGTDRELPAEDLAEIVESSMSSGTCPVLKRPDELEAVARGILEKVAERYPGLPDGSFVLARQENMETLDRHNAFAESYGTLGEIRGEILDRKPPARHTTLQQWLEGADDA